MLNMLRLQTQRAAGRRLFSSTSARSTDLAKLILIGRLGRAPESRTSQSNKEYVHYTVATTNFPPPPPNADGTRDSATTSWHNIVSFNPNTYDYLKSLRKGSQVYVEANYELRDADPLADPESPQGQRQIFLRHEMIRTLKAAPPSSDSQTESSE